MTDEYDELDLLTGGQKYPAPKFREDDFIRMYRPLVSRYLDMRVLGAERESAFLQCFGTDYYDQYLARRIEALEGNEAFQCELAKRLDAKTPEQMFDLKKAIFNWLQIINSSSARDSSKVAAIKELQVLYGLTVIDADGNTRAGKTLADFYSEQTRQTPLTAGAGELHAEPGSAEAQAFEANTK